MKNAKQDGTFSVFDRLSGHLLYFPFWSLYFYFYKLSTRCVRKISQLTSEVMIKLKIIGSDAK